MASTTWKPAANGPKTIDALRAALTVLAKKKTGKALIDAKFTKDHIYAGHEGSLEKLASALAKLAEGAARTPNPVLARNPAAAALYIVPALRARGGDSLFSTHPDTANRIAALRAIADEMGVKPRVASVPRVTRASAAGRRTSALDPLRRG